MFESIMNTVCIGTLAGIITFIAVTLITELVCFINDFHKNRKS